MRIVKISSKKSRTIGVLDSGGRTKFKKIDFFAEAQLDEGDDPKEAYSKLSNYIDECLFAESKK